MRCKCCNRMLCSVEMGRKYPETDEFIGLCNNCNIPYYPEGEYTMFFDRSKNDTQLEGTTPVTKDSSSYGRGYYYEWFD